MVVRLKAGRRSLIVSNGIGTTAPHRVVTEGFGVRCTLVRVVGGLGFVYIRRAS